MISKAILLVSALSLYHVLCCEGPFWDLHVLKLGMQVLIGCDRLSSFLSTRNLYSARRHSGVTSQVSEFVKFSSCVAVSVD